MEETPPVSNAVPGRRGLSPKAVIAIVVAAVLVSGGVSYVLFAKPASAQTVKYEKPTTAGADPFTAAAVTSAPKADFSKAPGQPFGGSGNLQVCDREKLISFLNSHPAQKAAWLDVLGVESKNFEKYVRSLTPVVLGTDVRVTNHGFKDGHVYELQSILAKGTAVLADKTGEIVTKCYCGNPLTPPVITTTQTTCEDCPPAYTPPPPCTDDCYECPDLEGCPSPAPVDPCPSDGCAEPTDPNNYSDETPVPPGPGEPGYGSTDNSGDTGSPDNQATDTNTQAP